MDLWGATLRQEKGMNMAARLSGAAMASAQTQTDASQVRADLRVPWDGSSRLCPSTRRRPPASVRSRALKRVLRAHHPVVFGLRQLSDVRRSYRPDRERQQWVDNDLFVAPAGNGRSLRAADVRNRR